MSKIQKSAIFAVTFRKNHVFQKTNSTTSLLPPTCRRSVCIPGSAERSARKLKIFKIARNLKILASIKNYFRCLYKKLIFGRNGAILRKIIPLVWAVDTAAIATSKWLPSRHYNRPDFNRRNSALRFCRGFLVSEVPETDIKR